MTTIQKIKAHIDQKGITIYRLSKLSGLSRSDLGKYFSGDVKPGIDKIEVIVKSLGLDINLRVIKK